MKKGHSSPATVGEYIASVPEPARSTLKKLRASLRSAFPVGAAEVISYQMPAFRHGRSRVWFAAFSAHCSLFPGASVIDRFKRELKAFRTSKGTIQFPVDKPLSVTLIRKMVKARLALDADKPNLGIAKRRGKKRK